MVRVTQTEEHGKVWLHLAPGTTVDESTDGYLTVLALPGETIAFPVSITQGALEPVQETEIPAQEVPNGTADSGTTEEITQV